MPKKILLMILCLSLFICALVSCGEEEEEPMGGEDVVIVDVSSVGISESSVTVAPGEAYILTGSVAPDDATDKTLTWYSTNTSVVTVANGVAVGLKEGVAKVVCESANGKYATCEVTVKNAGHEHVLSTWIIDEEVSCGSDGVKHKECTVCHRLFDMVVIDKSGAHTPASAVQENIKPATCYTAGSYDAVVYCSECREELMRKTEQTAQRTHSLTNWVGSVASCTQPGIETRGCRYCSFTEVRQTDALGHDVKTVEAKAATCTEVGWGEYEVCKREGCTYSTLKEITKQHSYGTAVTENRVEATCSSFGSYDIVIYCADCDSELLRIAQTIEKREHAFGEWSGSSANCYVGGTESRDCKACGYRESFNVAPLGHKLINYPGKAATCTEPGWEAYAECQREGCGYSTYKAIAAGHVLKVDVLFAPTETSAGTGVIGCDNDGCQYLESITLPELSSGVYNATVVSAPTETSKGLTRYEYVVISKDGAMVVAIINIETKYTPADG